ncbi:MAG: hypothetical protein PUD34_03095 [bacterium]|nr:hypothetical protein [bacterium]
MSNSESFKINGNLLKQGMKLYVNDTGYAYCGSWSEFSSNVVFQSGVFAAYFNIEQALRAGRVLVIYYDKLFNCFRAAISAPVTLEHNNLFGNMQTLYRVKAGESEWILSLLNTRIREEKGVVKKLDRNYLSTIPKFEKK